MAFWELWQGEFTASWHPGVRLEESRAYSAKRWVPTGYQPIVLWSCELSGFRIGQAESWPMRLTEDEALEPPQVASGVPAIFGHGAVENLLLRKREPADALGVGIGKGKNAGPAMPNRG